MTIDLSNYVRVGRYDLPEPTRSAHPANNLLAQEASAVTYNWDTGTLFIVGDAGTAIVEVSLTGQYIGTMTLAPGGSPQGTDFYDPEGLAYVGGGQFVMTEERDRNAVKFTYAAGTTLSRAGAQTVDLGTFVENIGLEGVTYDPLTGGFIFAKEKQPEGLFQTTIDFAAGTASNGSPTTANSINLFDPTVLNLADIADVFALANVSLLAGTPQANNLLVLSQETGKIVETDRAGNIISSLTLQSDPGNPLNIVNQQHEGVTMGADGTLYVVSENGGGDADHPQLWVYKASNGINAAPTAIALANATASIAENSSTTVRLKVADVQVADDGLGTNNLSVSGTDAASFEVDNTGLYIKAGVALDYETKTSYNVTVNVDDVSIGSTPDASTAYTLDVTDVPNENALPSIYISEVSPWSSGNSPFAADWFELTNGGTSALNITGWKIDDDSNNFAVAVALSGVTSIAPGESVIFLETSNLASVKAAFIADWFNGSAPAGLQIGAYSGSGVGLSANGDQVNLFNAAGVKQAGVIFGTSPGTPSLRTFDNSAGLNAATITSLSSVNVNGGFSSARPVAGSTETGSPGAVAEIPPVITSNGGGSTALVQINENTTAVTTVTATDKNFGDVATFAITGGADAAKFAVNTTTGALRFIAAPDFEAPTDAGQNNFYDVVVTASDGTLTDSQAIQVKVNDLNDNAPAITSPASTNFAENGIGAAYTITATDADTLTTLSYSIGGTDAGLFNVNAATGVVSFKATPNFEAPLDSGATNIYNLTVTASDGTNRTSRVIAIAVTNVAEAPAISSNGGGDTASISIAENISAVTDVVAADPDAGSALSYSIAGGADAAQFTIDASTGALSFIAAPDFDVPGDAGADNVYDVIVRASDGVLSDDQAIAVAVTDLNDSAPVIGSNGGGATASISISENTSAVTTVVATDADLGTTVSYAIAGGADAAKFAIDGASGALSFIAAPDFDVPGDAGTNNVYDVIVRASDGALSDDQAIAVAVTDVNDSAPVIGSNGGGATASISISENTSAVTTVVATDADLGTTVSYAIAGGADAAKFAIDGASGALSFRTAPNFERPADADGNNVYDVVVSASDGTLSDEQAIAVTISDVADTPVYTGNLKANVFTAPNGYDWTINGLSGNDTLTGSGGSDTVDGGDGNDTLNGGIGADTLIGGRGSDTYIVDNVGDVAVEAAVPGVDKVISSVSFTLGSNIETLELVGAAALNGSGNELNNTIVGNNGGDVLDGGAGADKLFGGSGADLLFGGTGLDAIDGGAGDDVLIGGPGRDKLIGGSGADRFVLNGIGAASEQAIVDFTTGQDLIVLDRGVFTALGAGTTLSASEFAIGSKATTTSQHVIYNQATGVLTYDADGSGKGTAQRIATIQNKAQLSAASFSVADSSPSSPNVQTQGNLLLQSMVVFGVTNGSTLELNNPLLKPVEQFAHFHASAAA